jgi:hypothetical protein
MYNGDNFTLVFSGVRVAQSLVFCVVFCRSLFVLLCFFFWSLYCLSFFDWQFTISDCPFHIFKFFLIPSSRKSLLNFLSYQQSTCPQFFVIYWCFIRRLVFSLNYFYIFLYWSLIFYSWSWRLWPPGSSTRICHRV